MPLSSLRELLYVPVPNAMDCLPSALYSGLDGRWRGEEKVPTHMLANEAESGAHSFNAAMARQA